MGRAKRIERRVSKGKPVTKAAKKAKRKAVVKKIASVAGKALIPPAARMLVKGNRLKAEQVMKNKALAADVTPVQAAIAVTEENPEVKAYIKKYVAESGVKPSENPTALLAQAAELRSYAEAQAVDDGMSEEDAADYIEEEEIQESMEEGFDPASIISMASNAINKGKEIVKNMNAKRAAKGKPPLLAGKKKKAKIAAQAKDAANAASGNVNTTDLVKVANPNAQQQLGGNVAAKINEVIERVKEEEKKKFLQENWIWIALAVVVIFFIGKKSD